MRIADVAGLDDDMRRGIWHQALLRYIGGNADGRLLASAEGDNMPLGAASPHNLPLLSGHCDLAQRIAGRIGLPDPIVENLGQLYERWDGKGMLRGLAGDAVKLPVRLVTLAQDAIALVEGDGRQSIKAIIAERAGGAYEASLAGLFISHADALMAGLDQPVDRETVLALEPEPHAMLDEDGCEAAFLAIADMIDMRMPFTHGHSRAVASLTETSCKRAGLPPDEVRSAKWAAYAHDIGELAVPVSTWMRAGALTERETDAAHLHPYHGERALAGLGAVEGKAIAALVLRHHERLDGAGYHRCVKGNDLSLAARILATAEAFQTAREPRAYRPAMSEAAAAAKLRGAVKEGKLCSEAVEAVLSAAGQPGRRLKGERIGGLTRREIEVLRLIVGGQTAKEAARQLDIAHKTADNHIQSLYSKIGVTTRAGAALYALEHGLV